MRRRNPRLAYTEKATSVTVVTLLNSGSVQLNVFININRKIGIKSEKMEWLGKRPG